MKSMISMHRMLAASGLLGQAASGRASASQSGTVKNPPSHEAFRTNLKRLMQEHEPPMSQPVLASASGVGQRSIGRILLGEQNPTLEMCDKLARVFNLRTWQLLQPDLDPANPPELVTAKEREMIARWKALMQDLSDYGKKGV